MILRIICFRFLSLHMHFRSVWVVPSISHNCAIIIRVDYLVAIWKNGGTLAVLSSSIVLTKVNKLKFLVYHNWAPICLLNHCSITSLLCEGFILVPDIFVIQIVPLLHRSTRFLRVGTPQVSSVLIITVNDLFNRIATRLDLLTNSFNHLL